LSGLELYLLGTQHVKRLLVLSAVLSVSAIASTIGTCVPGSLSSNIGNACALGDKVFENFPDSGDGSRMYVHIPAATGSFLEPLTGATFLTAQFFAGRVATQAGAAPNIPSATVEQATSDQLVIANSPGAAYTPLRDAEGGGPAFFAPPSSIATTSTLTGSGGTGTASPGPSSFGLAPDTVVPEPASFALIAAGLLGMGLLRKRTA